MTKHVLAPVALLLNSVVVVIPAWSMVPGGVRIDGDVLVKWPAEYKGKAVVPDGVHHIADRAFMDCKGVTDVVFPNGVQTIGEDAFSRCFGLTDVSIPESVTNIGNSAFFLCWNLTNLTIKAEARSIPHAMCLRCVRLECVEFPEKLLDVGAESFLSCRSLKSVEIPDGVTNISAKAFGGCARLKRVALPKGLKSIGNKAFAGCYDLHSVDGLMQLDEFGNDVFDGNQPTNGVVVDASVCGLDRIIRVATDEFLAEGYPCHVDIFALDRFAAHIDELKVGMTFSEVDKFVRRYGFAWSYGEQLNVDGVQVSAIRRLRFHLSRYGSVSICLDYRDGKVRGFTLSEAIKRAAKAGMAKSPDMVCEDDKRWLE